MGCSFLQCGGKRNVNSLRVPFSVPVQYRELWGGENYKWTSDKGTGDLHLQSAPQGDILSGRCSAAQVAPVSGSGSAAVCRKERSHSRMQLGSGGRVGCR